MIFISIIPNTVIEFHSRQCSRKYWTVSCSIRLWIQNLKSMIVRTFSYILLPVYAHISILNIWTFEYVHIGISGSFFFFFFYFFSFGFLLLFQFCQAMHRTHIHRIFKNISFISFLFLSLLSALFHSFIKTMLRPLPPCVCVSLPFSLFDLFGWIVYFCFSSSSRSNVFLTFSFQSLTEKHTFTNA